MRASRTDNHPVFFVYYFVLFYTFRRLRPAYMEMYYVPQIPDIALVNQVYP